MELTFYPGTVRSGGCHFSIGTAGSTTLVFQTVAPVLLLQKERSYLAFEGGTHHPFAPPFDFCAKVYAKTLRLMGGAIDLQLIRHGFYPAGGGRFEAVIHPSKLTLVVLCKRGALQSVTVHAMVAHRPVNDRRIEVPLRLYVTPLQARSWFFSLVKRRVQPEVEYGVNRGQALAGSTRKLFDYEPAPSPWQA